MNERTGPFMTNGSGKHGHKHVKKEPSTKRAGKPVKKQKKAGPK